MVLALDLGTSSVRSALFDETAAMLPDSIASRRYRVAHSVSHAAELDPRTLLCATEHCLRRTRACLTTGKVPLIAGSGFWHSLLGLDKKGEPLTPIYTWADGRAARDAARLRKQFSERTFQARTGCMLRASFWPAKLLWLRRTEPRLFRQVARWVSPAEWIFEKVFAVRECSHSMASGTGLYNLRSRGWDPELVEHCRLESAQLNALGTKLEKKGSTVFPAIGDGAAGNLGADATRPHWVAINVGTSAAVRIVSTPGRSIPFGFFQLVIDEKRNLLGGAISNAGSLRAWALRALRLPNDKQKIEDLLRERIASPNPLTILPFWITERAPTWPEHLPGTITGLSQAITAPDLFAAALASVCYRLGDILEKLESATGRAEKIIVAGGIQQSPAWLQLLADSLGRDLALAPEPEASLRGAAVYALSQLGAKVPEPKKFKVIPHHPGKARASASARARQRELEKILFNYGRESF
jgi:gluconokinase